MRSRSNSARSDTSNGESGGAPIRSRSAWTQRPNNCAPTLISAATAAIVRSVSITRCAASRRYSGVYVLLFFVDPIKDILSGQFRQGNPPRRCPGYRVNLKRRPMCWWLHRTARLGNRCRQL